MAQTGNGSGPSDKPDHEAPDPTYIGSHPANENVHLLRERKRLSYAANFEKWVPVYDEDTTAWSDHMVVVTACLYTYPVSDEIAKMVLFKKMDARTFPLVSEGFAPCGEKAKDLSFEKYADLLGNVFQPVPEGKPLEFTFIERKQRPNEYYETYVRNKYQMWKRVYPKEARVWKDLYVHLTSGLENKKTRTFMKGFRRYEGPSIQPYLESLDFMQEEISGHYLDGAIPYDDLKGMEAQEHIRLAWRVLAINADKTVKDDPPPTPPPVDDDSCHFLGRPLSPRAVKRVTPYPAGYLIKPGPCLSEAITE